ncbi:MAG: two-component regulator propeller domain-containing protein [Cytophagales bacterium]|nr:two-component regulator propeller domain-containing protein [Cytophagales bacterium]
MIVKCPGHRPQPRQITFALLLCVFAFTESGAQHPDPTFDHYNVEDGLSQSTVWNIFEDSKGFVWFCTPDGLNKFDGYTFKVYRNLKADTNSFISNHPVYIFEDSSGDLWIGHRGGLSKYHYRQDRFSEVYRLPEVTSEDEGLLPLHESGGRVWAWEKNRGILGFNTQTLQEEAAYAPPEKYLKHARNHSRFGKTIAGKAFISTTADLMIVFDFSTLQYTFLFNKILDPSYDGISTTNKFAVDEHGNLWIPGHDGLSYLDTKTLKSKVYKDHFKGIDLTSCAFDQHGKLWIGSTTNGLYIMDIPYGTVTNISNKKHRENGLLYNYIESLFKDSSGNMWIGTNGFGVQKYSTHKNKFDLFDLKIGTNAFGGNLVKAIMEDKAGNLYAGTFGNGLYIIDGTGGISNFSVPGKNNATGLAMGPRGEILISNEKGLFALHNDGIVPLQFLAEKNPASITSLLRTGDNEVLITTNNGVFHLKQTAGQYRIDMKWSLTSSPFATVTYEDTRGRIWIGTQRSFYVVDKNHSAPKGMENITKNLVKSFCEDGFGNIWIATLGELIYFNPETGKAEYLNEKDGFANTYFYAALPGNDGKVWVSSNKGLASYDPKSKSIKNYTVLDGLQSNEFNTGAFYKLKDGRLAFGGLNGFNVFDPTAIRVNPNLPRAVFTNFMVDDKPHTLDTAIIYKRQIDLDYSQNTFSFEFAGLEYTSPENNQYAYMLEGHDKEWVLGGVRRFARYSRLAPGQYKFKVKASNSDGVWNDQAIAVTVNVLPPVYLQPWFIILMAVTAVVVIVLVSVWIVKSRYRSRLRQLEINQKIQQERGRISRDLHDHVGSQLTFIINQLDGKQEVITKGQLAETRDTAKLTMSNLRETIWALHRETITLVDFTDHVKEFAMKQLRPEQTMQLDFSEQLNADHIVNPSKALNLFRIAQEAINNAIKHSQGTLLSISIAHTGGCLEVAIRDNGLGIPVEQNGKGGYGLQNIQFRAKEIDAVLTISSEAGQGTTIKVNMPLSS